MGRNSKKLRRQEYPDYEEMTEFETTRRPKPSNSSDNPASTAKPSVRTAVTGNAARSKFREGQLISSGTISGVVHQTTGDVVLLLAGDGIIHELKHYDVYLSQE